MNKELCFILAFVVLLLLLSGCGGPSADNESAANDESIAGSESAAIFSLSADDMALLDSMDRTTFEYLNTWISRILSGWNYERVSPSGSDYLRIEMKESGIAIHAFPQRNEPEHFENFIITLSEDSTEDPTEEDYQLYRNLCIAAAMWFFDGLAEEDAAILFDIEPVADENFRYEGDKPINAYYRAEWDEFEVSYSRTYGKLSLSTHMDDNQRLFSIWPSVLCTEPIVLELQEQINEALAQAGHPLSLSFWMDTVWTQNDKSMDEATATFNYTGSGEGPYSSDLSAYLTTDASGLFEFLAYADNDAGGDASAESQDAVRKILSTVASFCDDQYTKESIDSFFLLKNYKDSDMAVCNRYGAYVLSEHEGYFKIQQEQGKYELFYAESWGKSSNGAVSRNDDLEPLTFSGNIFSVLNAWGGPSVTDGQFPWMSYYDASVDWTYYLSGLDLKEWTDVYFEVVGVNAYFEVTGSDVTIDNDGIPYRSHQIGIDGFDYLDKEHYSLTMVFDSHPHFELNYNDDYAKLMGLEDGYYYKGASVEDIRHIPMCLSLFCDDGMTVVEAQELFFHTIEPTEIKDGMEYTVYCPREVAHILIYDPQTDACEYTVMTRADFEVTYTGSLDAFIQNYS